MKYRVWAEISLGVLEANCRKLIKMVKNSESLMIVSKANAYGHDASITLEVAQKVGLRRMGVGDSSEALALRQQGWEHQILVLGSLIDEELMSVIEENIDITVHSLSKLDYLDRLTRELKKPLKIHLKTDTGMGRFGTGLSQIKEMAEHIVAAPYLEWVGLCTHFASPNDEEFSKRQLDTFNEVIKSLKPLPEGVELHSSATRTFLNYPNSGFDFVRSGIGIYGIDATLDFRPALSLHSQIVFIKDVEENSRIGYQGDYLCPKPTRLAIIPIGYSDGFRFAFSDKGYVLIRGQKAPVRGRVSMDYTSVDITDIADVQVDDQVTLIGKNGDEEIRVNDWANWANTLPHEITCLLGNRVKRVAVS
jgi:alanine racemase